MTHFGASEGHLLLFTSHCCPQDGLGAGVAVGPGVLVGVGVADGPGVLVGVGVAEGPGVAVGVGVGVKVGVGVAGGVTVGVGVKTVILVVKSLEHCGEVRLQSFAAHTFHECVQVNVPVPVIVQTWLVGHSVGNPGQLIIPEGVNVSPMKVEPSEPDKDNVTLSPTLGEVFEIAIVTLFTLQDNSWAHPEQSYWMFPLLPSAQSVCTTPHDSEAVILQPLAPLPTVQLLDMGLPWPQYATSPHLTPSTPSQQSAWHSLKELKCFFTTFPLTTEPGVPGQKDPAVAAKAVLESVLNEFE